MLNNKLLLIMIPLILFFLPFLVSFPNQNIYLTKIQAINQCFQDGQIPCRWVLDGEHFYGSPMFNYLAPLPYYLGAFLFLVIKNFEFVIKIIFSVSLIGSFYFMYYFVSKFFPNFKAAISAFVYVLLTFLIFIIAKDGVGLAWGVMFFPAILLSLAWLSKRGKLLQFLLFSLSLAFLILSADFAPMFLGIIFLIIAHRTLQSFRFKFLLACLASIIFAALLSAFYLLPSVSERDLVHSVSANNPLAYLPSSATELPEELKTSQYQILTGRPQILNYREGTNWLSFKVQTDEHTIIRLSRFYFPDFKIFIDGREALVEYKNNSLGLMTIILGEGEHKVEGKLFDTPIRKIANVITIASVSLWLLLLIIQFKGVKDWLAYYRRRL